MTRSRDPGATPDASATEAETKLALNVLALIRTVLSSERSLMAWMRTSVSFYTFGFTLTRFLDHLGREEASMESPQRFGFALVGIGILTLTLATIEHIRRQRKIYSLGLAPSSRFSLPVAGSMSLLVIGIATLVAGVVG